MFRIPQTSASGGDEGRQDRPLPVGGQRLLGRQDSPRQGPGSHGRGRYHHPAQAHLPQRYIFIFFYFFITNFSISIFINNVSDFCILTPDWKNLPIGCPSN